MSAPGADGRLIDRQFGRSHRPSEPRMESDGREAATDRYPNVECRRRPAGPDVRPAAGAPASRWDRGRNELVAAIADATRAALGDLFDNGEAFYFVSLTTVAEGYKPVLSAWSRQALDRETAGSINPEQARRSLMWDYAASPYFNTGAAYFAAVDAVLAARPTRQSGTADDWAVELGHRLTAMELALQRLDGEGFFGTGRARRQIVINAEIVPADHGNRARALRLNPAGIVATWLRDVAGSLPRAC